MQNLNLPLNMLQTDSVNLQDLNKLSGTNDSFLDDSFSATGIFSHFLRSLLPILESDEFDINQDKTENEFVKLTNKNKLLPNSEINICILKSIFC